MAGIWKDPAGWGRELVGTKRRYRVVQLQTFGFAGVLIVLGLALLSAADAAVTACSSESLPLIEVLLASSLGFVILGAWLWPLMYLRALRAIVLDGEPRTAKLAGQRTFS
jgi:hypothetical protein